MPVKLYFDIEFDKTVNMTIDGEELLIKLIQNVSSNLYVQYNISSSIEEVLILDSSTEKKFSSHLIFPKIVFENNILCGVFVKNIVYDT